MEFVLAADAAFGFWFEKMHFVESLLNFEPVPTIFPLLMSLILCFSNDAVTLDL
jgi:hypothetical protein